MKEKLPPVVPGEEKPLERAVMLLGSLAKDQLTKKTRKELTELVGAFPDRKETTRRLLKRQTRRVTGKVTPRESLDNRTCKEADMPNKESNKTEKHYQDRVKKIQERSQQPPQEPVQLKLWPKELLAAPKSFLRSALFGVVERGKRAALKEEKLASWPGVELRFTGWQLDQADLDVWTQALQITKGHLGYRIVLNESQFLRALGRSKGGTNVAWLRSSLIRMRACDIWLDLPGFEYHGGLVDEFARDDEGNWVLQLNPRLAKLFKDGTTYLEVEQRKQLKTSFAKWLQGYISSHRATKRKPHKIGLEKLRILCGSSHTHIRFFKRDLIRAMTELESLGVVTDWQVVDGQVGPVLEFAKPRKKRS